SSRTVGRDMYWENIDEVTTQGIEVSMISQLMENLTGRLGYTFLDTENEDTGKELANKPKHKLDLEFDWKIPSFGLSLNLACQYIGERYDDKDNTIKLDEYAICNIAMTKDITRYGELFLRVDNIFGKKDVEDEYDIDGTEFLAGVKMKF
ncbi:TonB-dependent receptor, partial [bacterium]|nr:TonB-dependent receptor [bacterium]